MASDRRRGGEGSAMRAELIEAAEQLIREQGYPGVTSRTLADKVGLKRQIVHYYFKSMDEVFVAVIRRAADSMKARLAEAAAADEPIRALQTLNQDRAQAILSMELNALASRRPAVREEVARATQEMRDLQTQILERVLEQKGYTPVMRPKVAIILLTSLAQMLALEDAIEVNDGHPETLDFVEFCLRAFEAGGETLFGPANALAAAARAAERGPAST